MSFWSIFLPVFAALIGSFVVTELSHFLLGYFLHRKDVKRRAEFERKVESGEINPAEAMQAMFGGMGPGPGQVRGLPPGATTVSGNPEGPTHGQYL